MQSVGTDKIERIFGFSRGHQSSGVAISRRIRLDTRFDRFHHAHRATDLHQPPDERRGHEGLSDAGIRSCHEQPFSYSHTFSISQAEKSYAKPRASDESGIRDHE
jgi:hypothetical protein